MKIPNKKEVQQIAVNYSLDIDFKDFMNLYQIYSFLVNNTTLPSGNLLRFRRCLLERILKVIMTIDDKIRDDKLRYNINRDAAKISVLSSGISLR